MKQTTSRGLRPHIVLCGRVNVGKSSLLNYLLDQDVSIVSAEPGTTTDVVEKPMELLPIGPVVFLDTAGTGDATSLGPARMVRTHKALDRADVAVLVYEAGSWSNEEEALVAEFTRRSLPWFTVSTKGVEGEQGGTRSALRGAQGGIRGAQAALSLPHLDIGQREAFLQTFKQTLAHTLQASDSGAPPLLSDLVPPGGLAVLVVPIDLQAPKGRLILPQVQAIRDALDHDAATLVVKERELASYLGRLGMRPDLVVCDSQVVLKVAADTPDDIPLTTFSILFARLKGDLPAFAAGAAFVEALKPGDKVLIAESCSHHAEEDDIGRVKIPRWLRQYTGLNLNFSHHAGRDFPDDLSDFRLVVHCGGCMTNRRAVLNRIRMAKEAGVPITNYGLAISYSQGVLERVLRPFPAAWESFQEATMWALEKAATPEGYA